MSCWIALKLRTENRSQQGQQGRKKKDDTKSLPSCPYWDQATWRYRVGSPFLACGVSEKQSTAISGACQIFPFSPLDYPLLFSAEQVLSRCPRFLTTSLFFSSSSLSGIQVVVSFLGRKSLWMVLWLKALWIGKDTRVYQFPAHWSEPYL